MNVTSIARSILTSSQTDEDLASLTEPERVICWRFALLEQAGFSEDESAVLALRGNVDLHQATSLLRRGCSRETALRILL